MPMFKTMTDRTRIVGGANTIEAAERHDHIANTLRDLFL
jgi:hypothetical protein